MKPNILIVSTAPGGKGGVSSVVAMHSKSISNQCSIHHIYSHTPGSMLRKFIVMFKGLLICPWVILRNNIDLVHIHGSAHSSFPRKAFFMLIAKLTGRKVIYHMHSSAADQYFSSRPEIRARFRRWLMDQYDAMIVLSEYWKSALQEKTKTDIITVFNSVEKHTLPSPDKTDKFIVFSIGIVGHRKGTYDILKIAKNLSHHKDIEFRIAGGGPDFDKLKQLCADEKLDDMITWLGWIGPEERDKEMANADIFLLPSYHEGMPMAILEGMCADLPIISTPVGGIPDCIVEGKTGFLVNPGEINDFANRILQLKNNPELLSAIAKASGERASTVFSPEQFAENVMTVYRKVLNS